MLQISIPYTIPRSVKIPLQAQIMKAQTWIKLKHQKNFNFSEDIKIAKDSFLDQIKIPFILLFQTLHTMKSLNITLMGLRVYFKQAYLTQARQGLVSYLNSHGNLQGTIFNRMYIRCSRVLNSHSYCFQLLLGALFNRMLQQGGSPQQNILI